MNTNLPNGFTPKDVEGWFHPDITKRVRMPIEVAGHYFGKNKKLSGDSPVVYLVALAAILILVVPVSIYFVWSFAFVAVQLWNWFIIPFFHLGPVTILQMAGIGCFIRLFTFSVPNTNVDKDKALSQLIAEIIGYICMPWVSLLFGYIIHRLM